MQKDKVECYVCGKSISTTANYYYIDIYQVEDAYGKLSTSGMGNNLMNDTKKMFGKQSVYCEACVNKIKKYIEGECNNEHI